MDHAHKGLETFYHARMSDAAKFCSLRHVDSPSPGPTSGSNTFKRRGYRSTGFNIGSRIAVSFCVSMPGIPRAIVSWYPRKQARRPRQGVVRRYIVLLAITSSGRTEEAGALSVYRGSDFVVLP